MKLGPPPEPPSDAITSRYLNRLPMSRTPRGARSLRSVGGAASDSADAATVQKLIRAESTTTVSTRAESVRAAVSSPSGQALQSIIDMATDRGPWDAAGLVTIDPNGVPRSGCASSGTVLRLDELQVTLRQGPAIDSLRQEGRAAVICSDLAAEARWPRWRPAATAAGLSSLISLRLFTDSTLGALTFYSVRRFMDDDGALAEANTIAAQASVVLAYIASEDKLSQGNDRQNDRHPDPEQLPGRRPGAGNPDAALRRHSGRRTCRFVPVCPVRGNRRSRARQAYHQHPAGRVQFRSITATTAGTRCFPTVFSHTPTKGVMSWHFLPMNRSDPASSIP